MVDAHEVQNGRLDVVDVHRVFDDVEPVVVRFAVHVSTSDSAAGHPQREGSPMMVPPIIVRLWLTLCVRRAPEFAAPDDERIFQQAPLLQVPHQGG